MELIKAGVLIIVFSISATAQEFDVLRKTENVREKQQEIIQDSLNTYKMKEVVAHGKLIPLEDLESYASRPKTVQSEVLIDEDTRKEVVAQGRLIPVEDFDFKKEKQKSVVEESRTSKSKIKEVSAQGKLLPVP